MANEDNYGDQCAPSEPWGQDMFCNFGRESCLFSWTLDVVGANLSLSKGIISGLGEFMAPNMGFTRHFSWSRTEVRKQGSHL